MKKATILIQGMHCASCSSNVEKSLSRVKGIGNVRVNLIANKGYADCEDSVKDDDIKSAIKKAGYIVRSVDWA